MFDERISVDLPLEKVVFFFINYIPRSNDCSRMTDVCVSFLNLNDVFRSKRIETIQAMFKMKLSLTSNFKYFLDC